MTDYVRIRSGLDSATMSVSEWERFVDLVRGDVCPPGFLPVVKDTDKPEPGPGEELCFTYTKSLDGTYFAKSYFLAPAGTSFRPTTYSKLKLITAAKRLGRWDVLKAFIENSGYWDEWLVCQFLSSDNPQFDAVRRAVVERGVATDEEVDAILAEAVDADMNL